MQNFDELDETAQEAVRQTLFDVIRELWKADMSSPFPWKLITTEPALKDVRTYADIWRRARDDNGATPAIEVLHQACNSYWNARKHSNLLEDHARLSSLLEREEAKRITAENIASHLTHGPWQMASYSGANLPEAQRVFPEYMRIWRELRPDDMSADVTPALKKIHRIEPPARSDENINSPAGMPFSPWVKTLQELRTHCQDYQDAERSGRFLTDEEIQAVPRSTWVSVIFATLQYYASPYLVAELLGLQD